MHRSRLEGRRRNLEGFVYEPTWEEVCSRPFDIPTLPHIELDAVIGLATNVARAIAYVRSPAP